MIFGFNVFFVLNVGFGVGLRKSETFSIVGLSYIWATLDELTDFSGWDELLLAGVRERLIPLLLFSVVYIILSIILIKK